MARVLIIDDDEMITHLLEEHLTNEGYEVVSVSAAEKGLEIALTLPPDLILLDVNMPDATGFQVCGTLRQNPATQFVPIIMMTGAARWPNQQAIGRQMGANEYILKPFDVFRVGERVHELMGSKRPLQRQRPVTIEPETPQDIIVVEEPATQAAEEMNPPPLATKEEEPAPLPTEGEVLAPINPPPAPSNAEPLPAEPPEKSTKGDAQRFFDFSVDIVILSSQLPKTRAGRYTADQLIKSGTSVGARIQDSLSAETKEEFIRLLRSALKDLRETGYWLMLVRKAGILETPSLVTLEAKCQELAAALSEQVFPSTQIA